MKKTMLTVMLALGGAAAGAPVASEDARVATEAWLRGNGANFCTGHAVQDVIAECDDAGRLLWWTVLLDNGSAVIVSADTRIEPVITVIDEFADGIPEGHPLRSLLLNDMCNRLAAVESRNAVPAFGGTVWMAGGGGDDLDAAMNKAEAKWKKLCGNPYIGNPIWLASAAPIDSGDPARVIGMVDGFEKNGRFTHWNQDFIQFLKKGSGGYKYNIGNMVYNRFTPKNYVTGCIATIGSSLLQYFNVTKGLASGTYEYFVDGGVVDYGPSYPPVPATPVTITGCDYNWAILPKELGGNAENPSTGKLTDEQKDLLSLVPYHVGISLDLGMQYVNRKNALAALHNLCTSLRERFDFKDARYIHDDLAPEHFSKLIYGQIRAGAPVLLAINRDGGGHQVLAVGYGEDDANTPYTRLFMGWSGKGDAWYNLPNVEAKEISMKYDTVKYVTTMISAKDTKSVALYGRVMNAAGKYVPGAVVTAQGCSATTDANGYWGMRVDCTTVAQGTNEISCTYNGTVRTATFEVGAAAKNVNFHEPVELYGRESNWYYAHADQLCAALPGEINFNLGEVEVVPVEGKTPAYESGGKFDEAYVQNALAEPFEGRAQTVYEGVVYEKTSGAVKTKGLMSVKVKGTKSGYSMNVKFTGFAGTVSISAKSENLDNVTAESRGGETLKAKVGKNVIAGTISGGKVGGSYEFVASRTTFADRKNTDAQVKLGKLVGVYNVALTEDGAVTGYLSLNVARTGKVAVKGKMSDGTSVNLTGMLLDNFNSGDWYAVTLFKSLYRKTGGVSGLLWINGATGEVAIDAGMGWTVNWRGTPVKGDAWDKNLNAFGSRWSGAVGDYEKSVSIPKLEIPKGLEGAWSPEIQWGKLSTVARTGAVKGTFKLNFEGTKNKAFSCSFNGVLVSGGGFAFGTIKVNSTKYPVSIELTQSGR